VTAIATSYGIGVDIGGTFTDTIVIDAEGTPTIGKAPSTPPDFETGFLDSLASAAERMRIGVEELVTNARGIYHGCTVGTNALVEGRTAKVGLLTTRGAKDSLFIMQAGARHWGASPEYIARVAGHDKPEPLVPKDLVEEIDERITFDGRVLVELNEDRAREAIQRLLDADVEAIAISLLWSVVNPAHEVALARLVTEMAPDMFLSVSSEVVTRSGEYERTVATVINSLIGPVMKTYLRKLEDRLAAAGYSQPLRVMSCAGGVIDSSYAQQAPLLTIGSGPVAGLIGAGSLTRAMMSGGGAIEGGASFDVLTADMGGTTFDVGVIRNGQPLERSTTRHGQYEYFVPTLDVRSVGAGGGSIVRFDSASKTLRVGPQSAGARPGPAAYQRGGLEPTVTDADLVLGYLNPDFFLGGALDVSLDAATAALARVGEPLGYSAEETAAAAARIVDNQMADAIRLASVQQGYDPRSHVMYSYGGAGPVHATGLARELGIERVIVPLSELAAGWSAFGTVSADALVVDEAPASMSYPFAPEELNAAFERLEQRVTQTMEAQGVEAGSISLEHMVDMRYTAQVNAVRVRLPGGRFDEGSVAHIVELFEAEYARLFGQSSGFAEAGYGLTSVSVRGRATRPSPGTAAKDVAASDGPAPLKGERGVIFYERGAERVMTPVYDGGGFAPGMGVDGPAILEFVDTTVVLRDGQRASVDPSGSIAIDI
jgi:N-methylhydantoinase A